MRHVRFYEEFTHKRRGASAGTVLAVYPDLTWLEYSLTTGPDGQPKRQPRRVYECVGGVFARPNSPVAGTATTDDYLRASCKRVSEARARQVHPALFHALDDPDRDLPPTQGVRQ